MDSLPQQISLGLNGTFKQTALTSLFQERRSQSLEGAFKSIFDLLGFVAPITVQVLSTHYRELCVFSNASSVAISAVAYLRAVDNEGQIPVRFCMAKSRLAPRHSRTVPRLELCAAVFAVELANMLVDERDVEIHNVKFYTDSRVVLGYIYNTNRRFVYVANRVTRIRKSTQPEQWHLVSTDGNPADHGRRPVPFDFKQTNWFSGSSWL